jgi:hypothetical protein
MRKNTKRRLATKPIMEMKVNSKEQLKQTVPLITIGATTTRTLDRLILLRCR